MDFANKVVLITGGFSGIGNMAAQLFLEEGARVIRFDVDESKKDLSKFDDRIVDVRNFKKIQDEINDIITSYGFIDVVINCAGGSASRIMGNNSSFEKMSIEAIDWGVEVNFKGPLYMARACLPYMIERKSGVIINVGSISGVTGSSTAVDYSAEKSGLVGMSKSIALLGAPYGVRCCMVTPGPVLTREEMAKMPTPLGRAADPKEIADLILYLCSDKASFMTGNNVLIDGGRSCGGMKHDK